MLTSMDMGILRVNPISMVMVTLLLRQTMAMGTRVQTPKLPCEHETRAVPVVSVVRRFQAE